jgi:hypothetical protein
MNQDMLKPSLPWWRVPTVWLVVGGPALVVVASLATAVIAVRGGDRPVREASAPQADTMTPAKQARNHAATPRR